MIFYICTIPYAFKETRCISVLVRLTKNFGGCGYRVDAMIILHEEGKETD